MSQHAFAGFTTSVNFHYIQKYIGMNGLLKNTDSTSAVDHYSASLMALSEELYDSHVCKYYLNKINYERPSHAIVFEIADLFKIRCKFAFAIDTLSILVDESSRTPAIWVRLGEYSGLAGFQENELEYFERACKLSPELGSKFWYIKSVSDTALALGKDDYARTVLLNALALPTLTTEELKVLLPSFGKLGEVGHFFDIVNKIKKPEQLISSDGKAAKSVLIVDSVLPRYDQDAGSVLMQGFIRSLVKSGYSVWFYSGEKNPEQKYIDRLLENNVRYINADIVQSTTEFFKIVEPEIDVFMLTRANVGGVHFDTIRNINPDKPVIFNSVDLHFLRLERLYESDGHIGNLLEAKRLKRRESYLVRNSDASIIISDAEVTLLKDKGIDGNVWQLPIIVEFPKAVQGFKRRKNIAFIGSYVHTPNIDAVDYFCQEIWPQIYADYDDTQLLIVGPKAPERWMNEYHGKNNVEVVGFVEDLELFLSQINSTIVPLRYGAGQKGKIATSLAHGVPCISTEIGIEGMGLTDRETTLLSTDLNSWKANLSDVLENEIIWKKLSSQGQKYAFDKFSEQVVGSKLVSEINDLLLVA